MGVCFSHLGPPQRYLCSPLGVVQNKAAHFIVSNYSRSSSVTVIKQQLGLPSLYSRRSMSRLLLFHRSIHRIPPNLSPFARSTVLFPRFDHQCKVNRSECLTRVFAKSFLCRTAIDWNDLASDLAELFDYDNFRGQYFFYVGTLLCSIPLRLFYYMLCFPRRPGNMPGFVLTGNLAISWCC